MVKECNSGNANGNDRECNELEEDIFESEIEDGMSNREINDSISDLEN